MESLLFTQRECLTIKRIITLSGLPGTQEILVWPHSVPKKPKVSATRVAKDSILAVIATLSLATMMSIS